MDRPWLVTASDAAYYTGRPVGTVWRWATEGRITRHGTGKATRYDLREMNRRRVDEWTGEITPGAPPPLPTAAAA
ncbi:DNA-binding protein [Streptomyces sp. NPDC012888]|uniref:DNA-binding protein n=1 Tax=Streptomyces sp. NPDC012888 TaxID=3364855 RepID=UPI00368AFCEC